MAKKINIRLSSDSIEKAIKEIEQYQKDLENKCSLFVKELSQKGYAIANAKIASVNIRHLDKFEVAPLDVSTNGFVSKCVLKLSGSEALFLEFGSGSYYSPDHPLSAKFGYGSGTYPGQTHVPNPGYWWYKGDDGGVHFSRGNPSYAPMWSASQTMRIELNSVAKKIFKSGG